MHEGITIAFEKLLADTTVLEHALHASTTAHGDGGYTAVELLPTGDYRRRGRMAPRSARPSTGPEEIA